MKRLLLFAFAALSLAASARGKGEPVSQTTSLNNIAAQEVPTEIKSAQGLDKLTINFRDNSVTAQGSSDAVIAFEKELRSADVRRAQYRIAMRLVRYQVDKHGHCVQTTVETPVITTTADNPATLAVTTSGVGGTSVTVTLHADSDGFTTLTAQVQQFGEQGEIICSGKNTRPVTLGTAARVTGMTESADKLVRREVQSGEIVTDHGEYTGYYVEVTPTLTK